MGRWTLVTFGCAAVFAGCADTDRAPGGEEIDQAAQAIFKGKPDDAAHPQVVDLVVPLSAGQVGCTGVLVSSKTLLTAAHCALSSNNPGAPLDLNVQSYAILIENLDEALEPTFLASVPKQQGVSIGQLKPAEVLIHPSYNATRSAAHDVMLLVLPDPIPRSVMVPLKVSSGYGSGPTFWKGYIPRFFGVGPTDEACQQPAGIPVRFLDNATMKEPEGFFHFTNGGAAGHTCFGDSGGPYLTRTAQNASHPGHTLSDDMVVSILSQTLDGGDGDDVGPILEGPSVRPWLVANALDRDGDGMESYYDLCDEQAQAIPNQPQADKDSDHIGDACDPCPDDPDHGDADGDRILNCLDACPDDPLNSDADGDGIPGCADPCPKDGKLGPSDVWGDIDHDGICNAVDNCPFAKNGAQRNANRRFEEAEKVDLLGDRCDPVPVPDSLWLAKAVDDPGGLVPCVDPECPGATLKDGLFLACGKLYRTSLSMRPLRSQHRTNPNLGQDVLDVQTLARFCQKDDALDFKCVNPSIDIKEERLSDAQCVSGCANPEVKETRFHRMSFSKGGNAKPDDFPVRLDYTFGNNNLDRGEIWTWDVEADYARWITANPPLINEPTGPGGAAKLSGTLWFHANTYVGADPNVADPGFYHAPKISGAHTVNITGVYEDESGFKPLTVGCYKCFHLQIPDALAFSAGSGSPGAPKTSPPFFVWSPGGSAHGSDFRRRDAAPMEASLIVGGPHNSYAAVRTVESECNGELLESKLGKALRSRLKDTSLVWTNAAEPLALQGDGEPFPLAVALSAATGDLVDTVQSAGGALLADGDRAMPRQLGVSVPGVTHFASVLSRVRRGVFVIGGEDSTTGAPSGRIWFRSIEGRVWKRLPTKGYYPEKVLAATYSVATDKLYVLDERSDGTARLATVDPVSGAAKALDSWTRHPSWDLHWLVADQDGALLLASANRKAQQHVIARIDVSAANPMKAVSRLLGTSSLVLSPVVDASGYTLILRKGGGHSLDVEPTRLVSLPLVPAHWSSLGQQL